MKKRDQLSSKELLPLIFRMESIIQSGCFTSQFKSPKEENIFIAKQIINMCIDLEFDYETSI